MSEKVFFAALSPGGLYFRDMQQRATSLQTELTAAQAAADLESTLTEFRGYLDKGGAAAAK